MAATIALSGGVAASAAVLDTTTTEPVAEGASGGTEAGTPDTPAAEEPTPDTPANDAPAAAAPAEEVPEQAPESLETEAARDEVVAAAEDDVAAAQSTGRIWVSYNLDRLELAEGHVRNTTRGTPSALPAQVTGAANDIYSVFGTYGESGSTGIDLSTAYRIDQLGAPSGFWVATRVYESGSTYYGECTVFEGDPDAGGQPATQFVCSTHYTQGFPNAKIRFDISMNRDAEAWGILKTSGPVSLVEGTFEPELPYHIDGTPTVAENSSTSFNVVLRRGDVALINGSAATTAFVYRIAENGTPTQFYIAGYIQTVRGASFSWNNTCAVYDGDPRKAANPIDQQIPELASPYDCKFLGGRELDYRGNHEFTYEVVRRPMTVVTNPLQQKTLLAAHCSGTDVSHCGYALASVTDTVGKGRVVSARYNNTTEVQTESTYSISGTESVTVTGGQEYTFAFEQQYFIGKVSASVKSSWSRSTTSSTTTAKSYKIPIPPHMTGWLEATPPMVHTEGTIIVFDGSRYFELPNVYADLPAADREWEYTVRNAPFIGGELGARVPTDPATGLPLGTVTAVTPAAASARSLAATGSTPDVLLAGMAATAALLGAGLLVLRRNLSRRPRRT
ncbi:hypothetical protein [Microbacterium sp. SLBN-146]|uniref:hypothetical protein n=1 Tax=Microbacterium sp. SLBN-146 TaxID=2768457 RepID=UPI001153D06C|nr:hypothetical protein [Microbacterium sp. SLBN-146]